MVLRRNGASDNPNILLPLQSAVRRIPNDRMHGTESDRFQSPSLPNGGSRPQDDPNMRNTSGVHPNFHLIFFHNDKTPDHYGYNHNVLGIHHAVLY